MNPVGRNQPCPCGSGKRYKECHGALGATSAEPSAPAWLAPTMRDALHAQRRGMSEEAARLYRRVLAADPSNFDATHMLGLVEYECGRYDAALALIRRAVELRPDIGPPRHNLLVLEALPPIETEVCRAVLPRLMSRLDPVADLTGLAAAKVVNIVIADPCIDEDRTVLGQIIDACGTAPVTIWDEAEGDAAHEGPLARRLSAEAYPRGGLLIMLGTARSAAAWLPGARADQVLVVVTRDEPCAVIDRIDELAAAGYTRPGLVCATPALADHLRLPRQAALPQRARAAYLEA
jgi:tetratricopeptide (TPR) repeat protein